MIWTLPVPLLALTACMVYTALTHRKARQNNEPGPEERGFNAARFINMGGARDGDYWTQSVEVINCRRHPIQVQWVEAIGSDFDLVQLGSCGPRGMFGARAYLELDVPANARTTVIIAMAWRHEDWRTGAVTLEFWAEERIPGNEWVSRWTSYPLKIMVPDAPRRTIVPLT